MFESDKELKSLILGSLPDDGMSISALSRLLNEKGIKMHRLELSGYLKALSDMGVLREREVKPSKVFSPVQSKKKNLYDFLGEIVRKEDEDEDKRASMALLVLNKLFRRAVMDRELRMCGLTGTPASRRATEKERADASAVASKAGIKVGSSDIALVPTGNFSPACNRVVIDLLIEMAGLKQYVAETKQKTLLEEG
jgi:hypothetical protein